MSWTTPSCSVVRVGQLSTVGKDKDAESSTQEWVSNLTSASVDGHADYSSPGSISPQSQTELSPVHSCTFTFSSDAQCVYACMLYAFWHIIQGHTLIKSDSTTINGVRTRVGQVVKHVDHLLYQMSKHGVSNVCQFIDEVPM